MIELILLLLFSASAWAQQHGQVLECVVTSHHVAWPVELTCTDGTVLDIPHANFPYQPVYRGQGINLDRVDGHLTYSENQTHTCHDKVHGYDRLPVQGCFRHIPAPRGGMNGK